MQGPGRGEARPARRLNLNRPKGERQQGNITGGHQNGSLSPLFYCWTKNRLLSRGDPSTPTKPNQTQNGVKSKFRGKSERPGRF